jgi:hypothetical protein
MKKDSVRNKVTSHLKEDIKDEKKAAREDRELMRSLKVKKENKIKKKGK